MSNSKIRIYYQGDGCDGRATNCSQLEKKATITLSKMVKEYGDKYGYDKIKISYSGDHLILRGEKSEILMDSDINGSSIEYITKLTRWEWLDENYVEPKPLNKYTKIKAYHNYCGDGRTLTLPLSKECIEYGDRFGYDKLDVFASGTNFYVKNKEGGLMIYKDCWDTGIGHIIKFEWLNAEIESEMKKLKNQFTKVRLNHGANSKMTVALPKKLTEFGDRFGYDKITFARKGSTFYLYDPDGFILLRKDCWETGLGEIKSMEWLNDKSEAVPFEPAPAPFETPTEESVASPSTPLVEEVDSSISVKDESVSTTKPSKEEPKSLFGRILGLFKK